jgi:hypothetical protein
LVCPGAEDIQEILGASQETPALQIFAEAGYVEQGGRKILLEPTPSFLLDMVRCGGLMEVLRNRKK